MDSNWKEIFEKYKGMWVALKDDEKTVVGNGTTAEAALEDAENNGYPDPILFHVLGTPLKDGERRKRRVVQKMALLSHIQMSDNIGFATFGRFRRAYGTSRRINSYQIERTV